MTLPTSAQQPSSSEPVEHVHRRESPARPWPVHHGGGCGERFRTACCGPLFDPFMSGERLPNGDYVCHGCGHRWRHELDWRLAA